MTQLPYDPFTTIQEASRIAYEGGDKNIFFIMGGFIGNTALANRHYFDSEVGTVIVQQENDPHRDTSSTKVSLINAITRSGTAIHLDSRTTKPLSVVDIADELALREQRRRCLACEQ